MEVMEREYGLVSIGSALLDFTVEVSDDFIKTLGLNKGEMHLVDEERSREIFKLLKDMSVSVAPGGSSANTAAGMAMLGGKSAFMGRVASDSYGETYIRKTVEAGVNSFIKKGEGMTGHAITFITPDSERTFATHLGAAIELSTTDIDYGIIDKSSILHLEGYLFEPENLREICYRVMSHAKENGTLVSVDLSDPALIGRIKNIFTDVIENFADLVFLNEEEAAAFTGSRDRTVFDHFPDNGMTVFLKLGPKGSVIGFGSRVVEISPFETGVVNTNGAGDMYAAGIIYGMVSGKSIEESGRIASYASSLVVASPGARVESKIDLNGVI